MVRFRMTPELAQLVQARLRRSRLIQIVITAIVGAGVLIALWVARSDRITAQVCVERYAAAETAADTASIDSLFVDLGVERGPERGGREPVSCRALRTP